MTLYDAAVHALIRGRAIRRPSMPMGVSIVPVLSEQGPEEDRSMKAFLVAPMSNGKYPDWHPTIDDLVAHDWHVTHWDVKRNGTGEKKMIDIG